MKLIKVGGAVLNQTPLDWNGNKAHILEAIGQARAENVSVLCLPEMCITGYGCEDAFQSSGVQNMALQVLQEIVPETQGLVVNLGLPVMHRKALFNCAAMVVDGKLLGFVAKKFLAGDGLHYEPRWFKPWPTDTHGEVEIDGVHYPIGDVYFDCGEVYLGFEICEDAWVANRPGGDLSLKGVDIILNPSASHFAFDKHEIRKRFVLEGSRAFGVSYIYTNLSGNEAGRAIYDAGVLIASSGKMAAEGPRFTYRDTRLTTAVIDLDVTRLAQSRLFSHEPSVQERPGTCIEVAFEFPELDPEKPAPTVNAWEKSPHAKEETFSRAVPLALFDYLRKSRSRGFVVSLSGGADSTACACLASSMVRLAEADIGLDGIKDKLGYIESVKTAGSAEEIVHALLTCVYQATRNSSDVTRDAARGVAESIGAEFMIFDVDEIVQSYTTIVSEGLGRELSWDTDDIALQNIQARVRSPGVWMLANVKGALLVSTSNRSEAAVGYATMDGDTSGGISPIAGIDKAFLRRWLQWMETEGPAEVGPTPALRAVNAQQPTAELRPQEHGQTDEGDLMPYELLDAIERAAIRDKQSPVDVYRQMRVQFEMYQPGQLLEWVVRFFKLWSRNQWKRERYAPSFHLDDENLDPKTWCRFPILSGSYERELEELRDYVKHKEGV